MTRGWFAVRLVGLTVSTGAAITSPGFAGDNDTIRIGGTGMALATMQQAGASLVAVKSAVKVSVLPSLGTPGGLKALADGAIDIAVTGRRLKADETRRGAVEAGCTRTPLVFASSHPSPGGVGKADIPGFYSSTQPVWRDGAPLKVILRSRAGSENDYLKAVIPGMDAALAAAYQRPDIPVATTDQENADQASRVTGSFAVMTMLQIRSEKLNLRIVSLDGIVPSAATLTDKTYPLSATVCLVLPERPKAAAVAFVAHLKSEAGQALLTSLGATPLE